MAAAIWTTHNCSRFLSPTRVSRSTLYGGSSQSQTAASSAPSSPRRDSFRRLHAHPKRDSSTMYRRIPHGASIHSRGTKLKNNTLEKMFPSWNNNVGTPDTHATSKYSVSKNIAALNIELPKLVSDYSQYLLNRIKAQIPQKETVQEANVSKVEDATIPTSTSSNLHSPVVVEMDNNSTTPYSYDKQASTHDFQYAMSSMHDTIQNHYNNMAQLSATTLTGNHLHNYSTVASETETTDQPKSKSSTGILKQIASQVLPTKFTVPKEAQPNAVETKKVQRKELAVSRASVDKKTRGLVLTLYRASSSASRMARMEEFIRHVTQYPDTRNVAVRENIIPLLLRLRAYRRDAEMEEKARMALALVGFSDPVKARGIRILSLDGGGTRGLVTIELLRHLEAVAGQPIHKLFDYICGVSTGSLIAIMVGAFQVDLDKCEDLYKTFSTEMFTIDRWKGTSNIVRSHAYYDAGLWEKILQENIGLKTFVECAGDALCPKISALSALAHGPSPEPFVFRNYNLPCRSQSQYSGSCQHRLWEAIRASSAAPTYYGEFKLGDTIHQDGGVLANNPSAAAIHESRLLWPNTRVQCLVSVGTGRYVPPPDEWSKQPAAFSSIKKKVDHIVQSATDTEGVHTMLQDLMAPSTYFRLNPYMTEQYFIDEIRPEKWEQMRIDTQMFCRRNEHKLKQAGQTLDLQKLPHQRAKEWFGSKLVLSRKPSL